MTHPGRVDLGSDNIHTLTTALKLLPHDLIPPVIPSDLSVRVGVGGWEGVWRYRVASSHTAPSSILTHTHSHTHTLTHSLPLSRTHSLTRSFAPSLPRSLAPSLPRSLAPSLPRSPARSPTPPTQYHSLTHPPHSFARSLTHPPTCCHSPTY